MGVKNLSIFDFIGTDKDPLMKKLKGLDNNIKVNIMGYEIRRNIFGIYELQNEDEHHSFSDLTSIYHFLNAKVVHKFE